MLVLKARVVHGEESKPANYSNTYSKSTKEKLEKGVKYDVNEVVLVFLLLTLNYFL